MTKTVEARTTLPAPPEGYGEPIYGPHPDGPHVRFLYMSHMWSQFSNSGAGLCGWYALPLPKPDDPELARAFEQSADAARDALAAIESVRTSRLEAGAGIKAHEVRRRALARTFFYQDSKPVEAQTRLGLRSRRLHLRSNNG